MLRVQHQTQRIALQAWAGDARIYKRLLGGAYRAKSDTSSSRRERTRLHRPRNSPSDASANPTRGGQPRDQQPQPSLVEQLFPEETKRYEAQQRASREVPRLPVDTISVIQPISARPRPESPTHKSSAAEQLESRMKASGPVTSVLVLRNASPNLLEDDFRRLVPQGKHLEGWTLEQGDIVKVIPGRDLATLAPNGVYYLLFSSAVSAFAYQGHVTRIHIMAAKYRPTSLNSPIPPPPGHVIDGLDAHAAMSAYTLIPPTQDLELRQLKPPLSPLMQSLVEHGGYASLVHRDDRMPFEARLTLEGPQLHPSRIRYILRETGRARALGWSGGGDELDVRVTRWEPQRSSSSALKGSNSSSSAKDVPWSPIMNRTESEQVNRDLARLSKQTDYDDSAPHQPQQQQQQQRRRAPGAVYIVGFHTERAAQMFVHYWHQRPMTMPDDVEDLVEGDLAPVANVQLLW